MAIKCEAVDPAGHCERDADYFVQMDISPGSKECKLHAFEHIGAFMAEGYSLMHVEQLMDGLTGNEVIGMPMWQDDNFLG